MENALPCCLSTTPLELTYVRYDTDDWLGMALAAVTLLPVCIVGRSTDRK